MKPEDKELLLIDLCARLPYGIKFACNKNVYTATGLDLIVTDEGDWKYAVTAKGIAPIEIDFIKPYLFPISSMTEEQKRELEQIKNDEDAPYYHDINDFFLKYHLDNRHLIENGLALDATGLNIY